MDDKKIVDEGKPQNKQEQKLEKPDRKTRLSGALRKNLQRRKAAVKKDKN